MVVVDDRRLLARHVGHELLEPHADQPALGAELDAVALDLLGHARRQLRALEDDEHVVEHDRVLELERGQPRQHLLEPRAVRVERGQRLVRLREHVGDRVELVALCPTKIVTVSRCCEIEMTSAPVCFATRSAVRCRVPVSSDGIVGSGISWTFAYAIFVSRR